MIDLTGDRFELYFKSDMGPMIQVQRIADTPDEANALMLADDTLALLSTVKGVRGEKFLLAAKSDLGQAYKDLQRRRV